MDNWPWAPSVSLSFVSPPLPLPTHGQSWSGPAHTHTHTHTHTHARTFTADCPHVVTAPPALSGRVRRHVVGQLCMLSTCTCMIVRSLIELIFIHARAHLACTRARARHHMWTRSHAWHIHGCCTHVAHTCQTGAPRTHDHDPDARPHLQRTRVCCAGPWDGRAPRLRRGQTAEAESEATLLAESGVISFDPQKKLQLLRVKLQYGTGYENCPSSCPAPLPPPKKRGKEWGRWRVLRHRVCPAMRYR